MSEFYTFVWSNYDRVLISGYRNGKKFNESVKYSPYLFVEDGDDGEYSSIDGKKLTRLNFESLKNARDFLNRYREVAGFSIYGLTDFHYTYLYDFYYDQQPDLSMIRILNFDIETDSEFGYGSFTRTGIADREIISISVKMFGDKEIFVLGRKPYKSEDPEILKMIEDGYKIRYAQCDSEGSLLKTFIALWKKLAPDVIVGWNIEGYDIPFIIQRIESVLGEYSANSLSPFNNISYREYEERGVTKRSYRILGVSIIDSMRLYEKMHMGKEESYSLNYISKKILDSSKLDYSEYGSLARLYKMNFNKFIDYNIIDVVRVEQIDNYTGYLNLLFTMAYFAKVNFVDIFGTIKVWDVMIHNYLMDRKIAIKGKTTNIKTGQIAGGFVRNVHVGRHDAVISFDFTSLYPFLTVMCNISPDTIIGDYKPIYDLPFESGEGRIPEPTQKILDGELKVIREELIKDNKTITGKGVFFTKDKPGFVPSIMKELFKERKVFSKKESEYEQQLADIESEMLARGMVKKGDEWT